MNILDEVDIKTNLPFDREVTKEPKYGNLPMKYLKRNEKDDFLKFANALMEQPNVNGLFDKMEFNEENVSFLKGRLQELENSNFEDFIARTALKDPNNKIVLDEIDQKFPNVLNRYITSIHERIDLHKRIARLFVSGLRNAEDYQILYYILGGKIQYNPYLIGNMITRMDLSHLGTITKRTFIRLLQIFYSHTKKTLPHDFEFLEYLSIFGKQTIYLLPDSVIRIIQETRNIFGFENGPLNFENDEVRNMWSLILLGRPYDERDIDLESKTLRFLDEILNGRGIFNPKKYQLIDFNPLALNIATLNIQTPSDVFPGPVSKYGFNYGNIRNVSQNQGRRLELSSQLMPFNFEGRTTDKYNLLPKGNDTLGNLAPTDVFSLY